GVGIQVKFDNLLEAIAKKFETEVDYASDYIVEYLDDLLQGTDYSHFEVGDGFYTGNQNKYCILIKDVFKDVYNITEKVNTLIKFCKDNSLTMVGKADVVGGLEIY